MHFYVFVVLKRKDIHYQDGMNHFPLKTVVLKDFLRSSCLVRSETNLNTYL